MELVTVTSWLLQGDFCLLFVEPVPLNTAFIKTCQLHFSRVAALSISCWAFFGSFFLQSVQHIIPTVVCALPHVHKHNSRKAKYALSFQQNFFNVFLTERMNFIWLSGDLPAHTSNKCLDTNCCFLMRQFVTKIMETSVWSVKCSSSIKGFFI